MKKERVFFLKKNSYYEAFSVNTSKYFFIFPRLQGLLFPNSIWRPDRDVHEALNRFCFFLSVKRRYFKGKFPSISILFKYNITRYLKLRGNVLDKLTIFYLINVAVAMPCMGLSEICLEFMSCSTGYVQNV